MPGVRQTNVTSLVDLAHFAVTRIEATADGALLHGRFNHLDAVHEGRSWLYSGMRGSVIGDLTAMDPQTQQTTFLALLWKSDSPIQVGAVVPWFEAYWEAYQVAMIVSPNARWRRAPFIPSPTQFLTREGVVGCGPVGQALPEGAVPTYVDPMGWDHEHCEIWGEKIGVGGYASCYVNAEGRWLCEACYPAYGEPRNLGFLIAA